MTTNTCRPGGLRRLSRLAYLTARTTGDLLAAQARRKLTGADIPHEDLRLLKARGPVRSVLKEIQERGSAW